MDFAYDFLRMISYVLIGLLIFQFMGKESTNIGAGGIERACRGKGYTMQYFYGGFLLPVISTHKCRCIYKYYSVLYFVRIRRVKLFRVRYHLIGQHR